MVPTTTTKTTKSAVKTTTSSALHTEVTVLSKVNTPSKSTANTVTPTHATQTGTPYDTSLAENIANLTENDGIAEPGEYYYVEVPTQVDSEMVEFVETTILTDGSVEVQTEYEVDAVVEITVETPVETTNVEDVSVAVTRTAPAP